jgi:tryptophan synthase alpha chain
LTAGDPDLATTPDLLAALVEGGADVLELGVPFSDPIADGPVNQRSAARALAAGTRLDAILRLVAGCRDRLGVPIVLFTYLNPLHAAGIARFAERAAQSGVDGVLCLDLPPEEAEPEIAPAFRAAGLDTVFLLAPTSTRERVRRAEALTSGFLYYVSRTGVTGARDSLPPDLVREARRLRRRVARPLAVGFGLSSPQQVAAVGKVADGVVVGSALVELVERHASERGLPSRLAAEAARLAAPLRGRR